MKRMLAIAVLLMGLCASLPAQQIVIDTPGFGSDVKVTGSGAPSNGLVELFVNDVSQGSVGADGFGDFTFNSVNLSAGDDVAVQASLVWNFNTDGDYEGWQVSPNGHVNATVSGGLLNLDIVNDTDPYIFRGLGDLPGGGLNGSIYKSIEIRYLNPNATPNIQCFFATSSAGPGAPSNSPLFPWMANMSEFETLLISPDYIPDPGGNISNWAGDGSIASLRFDPSKAGAAGGTQTLQIDYIRVNEMIAYEFREDGDENSISVTSFNNVTSPTANGGVLSVEALDVDAWIRSGAGKTAWSINQDSFSVLELGGVWNAAITTNSVETFWTDAGGPWGAGVGNRAAVGNIQMDGRYQSVQIDIPGFAGATWGGADNPAPFGNMRYDLIGNSTTSDTVNLDYIRLRPAASYGPAAETVSNNPGEPSDRFGWPIQCVRIPTTGTAPTIDGAIDIAAEYAQAGAAIPIELNLGALTARDPYFTQFIHQGTELLNGNASVTGNADLSATMYFVYDDQAMYVAVEGRDELNEPGGPDAPNSGDAFQLCLDYDNLDAPDGQVAGSKVYIPSWTITDNANDPARFNAFWPLGTANPMTGTTWQVVTAAGGYTFEARIPWTAFTAGGDTFANPFPPLDGQVAGVLPILLDFDSAVSAFLYTEGNGGNIIVNAGAYGDLIFVETPTGIVNSALHWAIME